MEVTAAKHRTVLALLISRRNTPLSRQRLVVEVWPEHPPRSAVENVRTYVSAVRGLLGAERGRLTSCQGSYRLEAHDEEYDVGMFLAGVRQARSAQEAGDLPLALDRYAAALALWRGDPLQDVPAGPSLRAYGAVLAESGAQAREEYFEALFRSGEVEQAVAGLRQLLADHPTRECAWHRLVSILYRSGDRVAALTSYQTARDHLAEGLGLDPGAELVALHQQILQGVPLGRPGRPPPRQLPRSPGLFIGRQAELRHARQVLRRRCEASVIVGIHGLGGVGKSTLALAVAHAVAEHYPDGQLYVDLQGSSPGARPLEPVEVLGRFLRALGAPEEQISPDVNEAAAVLRTCMATRRMLVVLDNAASVGQVVPLLPAGRGCAVLVTSRQPLDILDGVDRIHLSALAEAEAVELLGSCAGRQRVAEEPEAALEIARLCGLLPLAVRIIAIRMARRPDGQLRDIADRLAQNQYRLDELGCGDLDVRSTFDVGYQALSAQAGAEQACRLFSALGRWPLGEIGTADAAALLGVAEPVAWRALELLAGHGLIEATAAGFVAHDLVRLFAAELATRNARDGAQHVDAL
ncbi:MAG TPA: BTAD domain-containing putative transcriptional regulator [Micromonosporaceae bacterium]|nr:BTAD domain-containing putative transcriptional regulator [Micromonosporaceae bacterium]